jgi:hypothetical protein
MLGFYIDLYVQRLARLPGPTPEFLDRKLSWFWLARPTQQLRSHVSAVSEIYMVINWCEALTVYCMCSTRRHPLVLAPISLLPRLDLCA